MYVCKYLCKASNSYQFYPFARLISQLECNTRSPKSIAYLLTTITVRRRVAALRLVCRCSTARHQLLCCTLSVRLLLLTLRTNAHLMSSVTASMMTWTLTRTRSPTASRCDGVSVCWQRHSVMPKCHNKPKCLANPCHGGWICLFGTLQLTGTLLGLSCWLRFFILWIFRIHDCKNFCICKLSGNVYVFILHSFGSDSACPLSNK